MCAGFLYTTDSAITLLEFIISNPKANKEKKSVALDLMYDSLIQSAKEQGSKFIFSAVSKPSLIKKLEKYQFAVADKDMVHMGRLL